MHQYYIIVDSMSFFFRNNVELMLILRACIYYRKLQSSFVFNLRFTILFINRRRNTLGLFQKPLVRKKLNRLLLPSGLERKHYPDECQVLILYFTTSIKKNIHPDISCLLQLGAPPLLKCHKSPMVIE